MNNIIKLVQTIETQNSPEAAKDYHPLKEHHQARHKLNDLQALLTILDQRSRVPDHVVLRAVDIIKHRLLTHSQVRNILNLFDEADSVMQTYVGEVVHRSEFFVIIRFEIDGADELRQLAIDASPHLAAYEVGDTVFVKTVLQVKHGSARLTKREKFRFGREARHVEALSRAILKKGKHFSDDQEAP
jgi:hypothetical protein